MATPKFVCLEIVICFVCVLAFACSDKKAGLVLKNATVHTVDDAQPQAQAVAIADGRILAIGSDSELEAYVGPSTQVIDLEGKTVVPGFADAHYHFMGVGSREFNLNLDGTKTFDEFLSRVRASAREKEPGEWITGRGWIEEDWPSKTFPTRYDLDKVAPDNPVMLRRADGHAAVVNSMALELAAVTKETPDPQGGQILRDESGEANGLLLDRAMRIVGNHMPSDTSAEMMRKYAKKADEVGIAYGVTQVHDMGTNWRTVDLWKEMYDEGELKTRIYAYIRGPSEDSDRLLEDGAQVGLFDDRLTVRGIKISQDGALGSRGAALLEPYSDAETSGLLIHKDEEIYPTIKRALENGIQMAIHAIGDRANQNVLDLYEKALQEVPEEQRPVSPPRFRIEHAQIVAHQDMPRFGELGVIPSMQPSHAIGDLHFAVRRLGLERMTEGYAWRTFLDSGCYIPGGSDAPVEEGNPLIEFYAAAVRKDTTGFSTDGWHRELKMTREEALKSLTIWAAKAAFEEDLRGSITPGKLADLVVLDRDLMTEPDEELFKIEVLMTIIAGEIVYESKPKLTQKSSF